MLGASKQNVGTGDVVRHEAYGAQGEQSTVLLCSRRPTPPANEIMPKNAVASLPCGWAGMVKWWRPTQCGHTTAMRRVAAAAQLS
jgi:hypothetical protein